MSEAPKTPWHLWTVAIVSLLWNGSGAYVIMMAQAGKLPGLDPGEIAYYAAQPLWLVIATNVSLLTALAAGIALIMRKGIAVHLFAISLAAFLAANLYDVAAGTSRTLANQTALIVTVIIFALAVLQLAYAWATRRRGVLV